VNTEKGSCIEAPRINYFMLRIFLGFSCL